jgi:CheY-like chemotaxis protein
MKVRIFVIPGQAQRALAAGARRWLEKPVAVPLLMEAMAQAVGERASGAVGPQPAFPAAL